MSDICFVMMPFGEKVNVANVKIDFDEVYNTLIQPAIKKAGMNDHRADNVSSGEQLLKNMYGRILLCDFAIVDITFDNPNVFYELGVRHAARPRTTILIREKNVGKIPFDLSTIKIMSYEYDFEKKAIKDSEKTIDELSAMLTQYKKGIGLRNDSPIVYLFDKYQFPDIDQLLEDKDNFTQFLQKEEGEVNRVTQLVSDWKKADATCRISAEETAKENASVIKKQKTAELDLYRKMVQEEPFEQYRLLLAVLKAYKDINDPGKVAGLIESISADGRLHYPELEEKLIFAYKMLDRLEEAEMLINKMLEEKKYLDKALLIGLLASVYKRKAWKETDKDIRAQLFAAAIDTYQQSFDENPNSYYPGICMLNLLYTETSDAERFQKYLPLVEYSIDRRLKSTKEYWTYASKLELEVLKNNPAATRHAASALLSVHAPWKREITIKHLKQIADFRTLSSIEDKAGITAIIDKFISYRG